LNFRRAIDDAPIGFYVAVIEHMGKRIVPSGFARGADDEIEISRQFDFVGPDESHSRYHRGEAALLLAGAATPDTLALQFVRRAVNDFA
jgi:hypothetical protein